ncbi:uncharacterized protein LOC142341502 isoform X2 [Convolutriloba macropyga]|uniref:uncharacterized protein LOC142341502 isoform X2 n=1 Tax=Convolutriloba macropyga TaxID=536237 RepID=UPI003F51AD82
MRECNCLTTKPENPMDKSSYYVRNSRGSSRYNTVNKNNNTNMFTPTFSCRTTTRKMPAAFFICSLSFMLTICVSVASGDVLPSKWTIGEQLPQKPLPPHIEVSPGTQPQVQNLLANEPNCSRWIWGQCYFNYGMCGVGKQHATRSGEGCRIIGITSRCFKSCELPPPPVPGPNSGSKCIWGVDCDKDETVKEPKPLPPIQYPVTWDPDPNSLDDKMQAEKPSEEDDEHCRWEKAPWSKCVNGMKERLRRLRNNRAIARGLTCPSMKRDTKTCGSKSKSKDKSGGGNKKLTILGEKEGINYYPKSLMPDKIPGMGPDQEYAVSDPCKWDHSVKKCGLCDPVTMEKTCTMPLLSGNPSTCGDERKGQFSCME